MPLLPGGGLPIGGFSGVPNWTFGRGWGGAGSQFSSAPPYPGSQSSPVIPTPKPGREIVARRHAEWREFESQWRKILDALEGGDRFRNAIYGYDRRGMPVRNLIRHKREYPDPRENQNLMGLYAPGAAPIEALPPPLPSGIAPFPGQTGSDQYSLATDDDYELRRSRTPVPGFLSDAIEAHVSKIFKREVRREIVGVTDQEDLDDEAKQKALAADPVGRWWKDVDGRGTKIDDWMCQTAAPLFLALGQLDLAFDHPPPPAGETIQSMADTQRLGLDRCITSYILPENLVWWREDLAGRYAETLTKEYGQTQEGQPAVMWRHWTADGWRLYDNDGNVLAEGENAYRATPLVRIFDRRKFRTRHVGQSRYEKLLELLREYYNRDSETILSDSVQAHPLLTGPADSMTEEGALPIGPGWVLVKPKHGDGVNIPVTYGEWGIIDFPKGGAESIRQNIGILRDEIDRTAMFTKPAGVQGTGRTTVAQSGISKRLDKDESQDRLSEIAKALQRFEETCIEFVLLVTLGRLPSEAEKGKYRVVYATDFDLLSAQEMLVGIQQFEMSLDMAGACPEADQLMLERAFRSLLPGLDDAVYARVDDEIAEFLAQKQAMRQLTAEGMAMQPGANGTGARLLSTLGNLRATTGNGTLGAAGTSRLPGSAESDPTGRYGTPASGYPVTPVR